MHAMVLQAPAPLAADPLVAMDLPEPDAGPGELRLRVQACAVCRTDLHVVEGELPPHRLPLVPGHQIVGRVDAVGAGVHPSWVGRRVGVAWLRWACGVCRFCREGRENLCPDARFTGWDADGGYAEVATVPAAFAFALPDALTDVDAAPLLCAGIIGYRALRLAGVGPGVRLGLFGFGASAHLALQVARHMGCQVFVYTRGAAHRALATRLGAVWAGGAEDGVPASLDAAVSFAPAGAVLPQALRLLRPGGTLAVNAVHLDGVPGMDYALLYGERTLRSVANATRRDGEEFIRLAAEIPVHVVREVSPLAAANAALRRVKDGSVQGVAVLVP
jgi:propanol-preferring alcohol dehydrogenase